MKWFGPEETASVLLADLEVRVGGRYHIALETPEANLADGARRFESTFGDRFNFFLPSKRGHLSAVGRAGSIHRNFERTAPNLGVRAQTNL